MWNLTPSATVGTDGLPHLMRDFQSSFPSMQLQGENFSLTITGCWSGVVHDSFCSIRDFYDDAKWGDFSSVDSYITSWGKPMIGHSLESVELVTSDADTGSPGVAQFVFSCGWIQVIPDTPHETWRLTIGDSAPWIGEMF